MICSVILNSPEIPRDMRLMPKPRTGGFFSEGGKLTASVTAFRIGRSPLPADVRP